MVHQVHPVQKDRLVKMVLQVNPVPAHPAHPVQLVTRDQMVHPEIPALPADLANRVHQAAVEAVTIVLHPAQRLAIEHRWNEEDRLLCYNDHHHGSVWTTRANVQ